MAVGGAQPPQQPTSSYTFKICLVRLGFGWADGRKGGRGSLNLAVYIYIATENFSLYSIKFLSNSFVHALL